MQAPQTRLQHTGSAPQMRLWAARFVQRCLKAKCGFHSLMLCEVSFRGVARGSSPAKVLEYMDDWEVVLVDCVLFAPVFRS
eukprot:3705217-Amphidinium_carterae.1